MEFSHLVQARAILFEDGGEWCQMGEFVSLTCDMPAPDVSRLGMMDRLTLAVRSISQSEWNMLTAMERLDWMRLQADTNEHIRSQWYYYASADIEFWHVNFRSLLDQVALVISELADAKRQVSDSFRKLYQESHPNNVCSGEGARFAEKLALTGCRSCKRRRGLVISSRSEIISSITVGIRWY